MDLVVNEVDTVQEDTKTDLSWDLDSEVIDKEPSNLQTTLLLKSRYGLPYSNKKQKDVQKVAYF